MVELQRRSFHQHDCAADRARRHLSPLAIRLATPTRRKQWPREIESGLYLLLFGGGAHCNSETRTAKWTARLRHSQLRNSAELVSRAL